MPDISVAFADDHPVFLTGVCQLFSALEGFTVVASGKTAQDIVKIARSVKPDIIVIDEKEKRNMEKKKTKRKAVIIKKEK